MTDKVIVPFRIIYPYQLRLAVGEKEKKVKSLLKIIFSFHFALRLGVIMLLTGGIGYLSNAMMGSYPALACLILAVLTEFAGWGTVWAYFDTETHQDLAY